MARNSFPYTPALKAFQDADDAWGAELERAFGKRRAEARYTKLGTGAEGTPLRKLFEARDRARTQWLATSTQAFPG